jgi:hypothetical protein
MFTAPSSGVPHLSGADRVSLTVLVLLMLVLLILLGLYG